MKPEEKARKRSMNCSPLPAGQVQDCADLNLGAGRGVACASSRSRPGFADYLLFVDRKAVGVVEAKAGGHHRSAASTHQSQKYGSGSACPARAWHRPLPFLYESTGVETFFTDGPRPRAAQPPGLRLPPARDAGRSGRRKPIRCAPACAGLPPLDHRAACGRRRSRPSTTWSAPSPTTARAP